MEIDLPVDRRRQCSGIVRAELGRSGEQRHEQQGNELDDAFHNRPSRKARWLAGRGRFGAIAIVASVVIPSILCVPRRRMKSPRWAAVASANA